MNKTPIYITPDDNAKLRQLLNTALYSDARHALRKLRDELDRAFIVSSEAIPPEIVALGSEVEFEDLETDRIETHTLTLPVSADWEARQLSILSPIGTALVGCRAGDVVSWATPVGIRRVKVRNVTPALEDASVGWTTSTYGSYARDYAGAQLTAHH